MSDGMGRELAYLSSHATNRYFIPNLGIPTYFVVNKEGKITYQKTSFPGVETLGEQLVSVMR